MLRISALIALVSLSSTALAQTTLEPFRGGSAGVNQRVYRDTRPHVPGVVFRNVPLFESAPADSGAMVVRMGDYFPPTVVVNPSAPMEETETIAESPTADETPRLLSVNPQDAPTTQPSRVTDGAQTLKPGQFYIRDASPPATTTSPKPGT
jgi:hypothetical protein